MTAAHLALKARSSTLSSSFAARFQSHAQDLNDTFQTDRARPQAIAGQYTFRGGVQVADVFGPQGTILVMYPNS